MNKIDNFFAKFELLANLITQKIVKVNKDDKDFVLVAYSTYGILSFTFSTIIAILISMIGYFPYIILLIFVIMILDSMSGIHHAKSHRGCFFYSQCMYLFCGLNIIFAHRFHLLYLILSILVSCYNNNPYYMENAPQHPIKKQKIFKRKYIMRLIIICSINLIFNLMIYFKTNDINLIMLQKLSVLLSVSILINKFSITKYSKKILDKLK